VNQNNIRDFLLENAYAESTATHYRRILTDLCSQIDPETMTAKDLDTWLESHANWGGKTKWLAFCAARSFLRWAYGHTHPALKLKRKVPDSPPQRTLSPSQAQKLLASFDTSRNKGVRDLAIATLLLDTGIRSSELCSLRLDKIDMNDQLLAVEVKGGRWEYGIFSTITAEYLEGWLDIRGDYALPSVTTLFVGIGGTKPGTPLTPDGLRVIVRRWGEKSGVGKLSPHDFRRSMATIATIAGAPSRTVQKNGRWKDIREVERYTRALNMRAFLPYSPVRYALENTDV
jgi:integrase